MAKPGAGNCEASCAPAFPVAIAGKLRDSGIKNKQLSELAESLQSGQAIVVALAEDESTPRVQSALEGYEGQLIVAAIDEEAMTELHKAAAMQAGTDG